MRIYNNLFKSNALLFQNKNNNRTGSIDFRASNFKTVAKTSRLIDNSLSASLDLPTQDAVDSIYRKLKGLKKYFERTNFQKAYEMRSNYPHILQKPELRGGYSFLLMEGENKGRTISIVRSKNASDILRLVISEKDNVARFKHYLIKGSDKVVANLNQKYPFMTPPKLRFMSAKELSDSGIIDYIGIIEKELDKYYSYLQGEKGAAVAAEETVAEKTEQKRKPYEQREMRVTKTYAEMTSKIFDIFDNGIENLPKHINPKVGPTSGKVLIINLSTEDGGELRVTKTMNPEFGDKLRYISIVKTNTDGTKKYLAIDTATKKFLKTDSQKGKPIIPDGEILFYTNAEIENAGIKDFFGEAYQQIFREPLEKEVLAEPTVEVLKIKEPVKVVDIDDSEIEPLDFEDKKLNNILEKTSGKDNEAVIATDQVVKVQKKRGRKPKALQTTSETEAIQPKKRGRKPKAVDKTDTEVVVLGSQFDSANLDKYTDIEQIKQKIYQKAEQDAKALADLYLDTLFKKFKENVEGAMTGLMERFSDIFKN